MEDQAFSVVFFPADNSVEVVPTKWLSPDNQRCPFPRFKSKALKKLQEDPNSDPVDSWPVWEVSLLKSYDTFSKANKKAKSALKKKNLEVSESEEGRSRTSVSQSIAVSVEAPTASLFLEHNREPNQQDQAQGTDARANLSQTNLDEQGQGPDISGDLSAPNIPTTIGSELQIQVEDPRLGVFIEEFRAFQESTIHNQLLILEEIKELKRLVLRNSTLQNNDGVTRNEGSIAWPLKSDDDFTHCEIELATPANFSREVALLSRIGGGSVAKTVNNVLKFIIWHEFALQVRITKQSGKTAFGGSLTAKLVKDSVRKFYESEESNDPIVKLKTTDDQLDSLIGKWFRDSVGRGDYGKHRRAVNRNSKNNEAEKNSEEPEGNVGENPGGS